MAELKSKLENEDMLRVLKFCKENNIKIIFDGNGSSSEVNMRMYDRYGRYVIYSNMFSENDIKESEVNIAEMFLAMENNKLHPDPDIYNYSGETRIVCYDYLDGDERYRYVVLSIEGRHPTVYIQFPGIEKIESYDGIVSPKVHGGFTFLGELAILPEEGIWLGWDYAHCGDYVFANWNLDPLDHMWTKKELADEAVDALTKIRDRGLVLNTVTVIGRAE